MKILVISGFLGAGKTTFIKKLIEVTGKTPVVLENEYGQNNLDSMDIQANSQSDLKLLEFMEGCVCCTQKDKFSNTILAISAGIDPEYLIVEPTGVGKLSNILNAINKVSYEKIQLLNPITIITAQSFDKNLQEFKDIYVDQIKNAKTILFSKNENISVDEIKKVEKQVSEINPSAKIITEHYSRMDSEWFNSLFLKDGEIEVTETDEEASDIGTVDFSEASFHNVNELVMFLEDVLHYEFGNIVRAKGIVQVGEEWMRFDVADRLYAITGSNISETQCVFIGNNIYKNRLSTRLNAYENIFVKPFDFMKGKSRAPFGAQ